MNLALLILQLILCLAILYKEIIVNEFKYFGSSIFFIFYLFLFIVVPILININFGYARSISCINPFLIKNEVIYLIYNLLSLTLLCTSFCLIFRRKGITTYHDLNCENNLKYVNKSLLKLTNKLGFLIVLGSALFVYSLGIEYSDLFSISRFAWVESNDFNLFYFVTSSYLFALSSIYSYLFFTKTKNKFDYIVFMFVLIALIVYILITKDRKSVFYFISGYFASVFHKRNCSFRVKYYHIVLFFIFLVFIIFSQFLRDYLPRLVVNPDLNFFDEFSQSASNIIEYSDLSYFYRSSIESIYQNYENNYFIFLGLVRRVLLFFLPSSWSFGFKIEDISAIFSDLLKCESTLRRGSMPPGFFGLFVLSFGWHVSILLMPLISLFLYKTDYLFLKKMNIYSLNLISFFLIGVLFLFRGDESTTFYFFISNFLFLYFLNFIFLKFKI